MPPGALDAIGRSAGARGSVTDALLTTRLDDGTAERASMIVTSNKPFSAWGEIFGDEPTAVAMIDRLVHHAEIRSLKAIPKVDDRDPSRGRRPDRHPPGRSTRRTQR
jgi:IstB-like ATP binding protein